MFPSPSQCPQLTISERLKILYPEVDEEETPLPRAWSSQIQHYLTGLSQANRRAHYKGQANEDDSEIGCVRATHPVPPAAGIYYFEVKIISQGEEGWISVGLCLRESFLNALTGWQDGTFGYHGDDGRKFEGGWGGGWGEIPMGQLIPLVTSSAVLSMSRGEPAPSLRMASTWVWLLPVNINSTILISDKLCLCRSPCRALSNCGSGLQRCNY